MAALASPRSGSEKTRNPRNSRPASSFAVRVDAAAGVDAAVRVDAAAGVDAARVLVATASTRPPRLSSRSATAFASTDTAAQQSNTLSGAPLQMRVPSAVSTLTRIRSWSKGSLATTSTAPTPPGTAALNAASRASVVPPEPAPAPAP